MRLFNREFRHLNPEFLQDLQTLQSEGAIYTQFWQDEFEEFRFCRIGFTPSEIVEYIDASMAYDEFLALCEQHGDPDTALANISDNTIRTRVEQYNEWTLSIDQKDTLYCFAAFLGDHLEALTCGHIPDRYEFISRSYTGDRRHILTEILEMFPQGSRHLSARKANRNPYLLENEQDVQDLLYVIIKSVFPDTRIEEYTSKHADGTKRIDIVIPHIATVVEVKFIRDMSHSRSVADELKIDFESYHVHECCKTLIAYVWDSERHITDRSNFIDDLRGLRVKNDHKFNVEVMVKP